MRQRFFDGAGQLAASLELAIEEELMEGVTKRITNLEKMKYER